MTFLALFDLGFTELLVIGFVALLVFGGELPDVLRNAGRAYAKLRRNLGEVAKPVRDEIRQLKREMDAESRPAPTARAKPTTTAPKPPPAPTRYAPDAPDGEPARPLRPPVPFDPFDEPPPV